MRMPATVAALQQGLTVTVARLVRLDFAGGAKFLHQGIGPLVTADGQVWQGVGTLGEISDIERAVVPSDGGPVLTLSGVDPDLIAKTLAASSEVKGRPALISEQHYTNDSGEIVLRDAPLALYLGLMDRMWIEDQGDTATIRVSLVTLLHRRRRPAYGYLNDASQQKLRPGDKGASDIPNIPMRSAYWPQY